MIKGTVVEHYTKVDQDKLRRGRQAKAHHKHQSLRNGS